MKKLGFNAANLISSNNKTPVKKDSYFQGSSTNLTNTENEIPEIPVDAIISYENPRSVFDKNSIRELASSIELHGLVQPITVRKKGSEYHLIAGERRLRAFRLLKRKTIPAIIKNVEQINPENLTEIKLIENIQREDLSDFEIALTLSSLKSRKKITNEALALKINKSEAWVKSKIAHASALETISKEVSLTNLASLSEIPTSVWVELSSSLKESPKEVNKWINTFLSKKEIPKQADARIFAKSLKSKDQPSGLDSIEFLKEEEVRLSKRIKKLQTMRKEILTKIETLQNS